MFIAIDKQSDFMSNAYLWHSSAKDLLVLVFVDFFSTVEWF